LRLRRHKFYLEAILFLIAVGDQKKVSLPNKLLSTPKAATKEKGRLRRPFFYLKK